MHEQLEPTQYELQTLPLASSHSDWQVSGAPPPVPPVPPPELPPEHTIPSGGTGAPPMHCAGMGFVGLGGGGGGGGVGPVFERHCVTTSRWASQPRKSTPLPFGSHFIGACAKHWSAAS